MKTHVNDQVHAPVALTLRQKIQIFNGLRVGLAPESVWSCEKVKNAGTLPGIEPQQHSDPASSLTHRID